MKAYYFLLALTCGIFAMPFWGHAYRVTFVNFSNKPVNFMLSNGVKVLRDTSISLDSPIVSRSWRADFIQENDPIIFVEVNGVPFKGHGKGNIVYVFTENHKLVYFTEEKFNMYFHGSIFD